MQVPTSTRLLLLALGLLAALAVSWTVGPLPGSRPAPPRSAPASRGGAGVEMEPPTRVPARSTAPSLRSELVPDRAAAVAAAPEPAPHPGSAAVQPPAGFVRVHGRVRRGGVPQAAFDLVFDGPQFYDWELTDGDGRYAILLPVGEYRARAGDDGPALELVRVPRGQESLRFDIELPTGSIRGSVLRLENGAAVVGATVFATRVSSPGGADSSSAEGSPSSRTRTARDGSFVLGDLAPALYELMAKVDGERTPIERVDLGSGDGAEVALVFRQRRGLRGVVTGPEGRGAAVRLRLYPGAPTELADLERAYEVHTGYDGEFAFHDLGPGPYSVFATGMTPAYDLGLQTTVEIGRDPGPLELGVERCGALSAVVLRSDGSPLPGAQLVIQTSAGRVALLSVDWFEDAPRSDSSGSVVLTDAIPGTYRIRAEVADATGAWQDVTIASARTTSLELILDP